MLETLTVHACLSGTSNGVPLGYTLGPRRAMSLSEGYSRTIIQVYPFAEAVSKSASNTETCASMRSENFTKILVKFLVKVTCFPQP